MGEEGYDQGGYCRKELGFGLHHGGEMERMYFESIRCDDGVYVCPEKKKGIHSKFGELCN